MARTLTGLSTPGVTVPTFIHYLRLYNLWGSRGIQRRSTTIVRSSTFCSVQKSPLQKITLRGHEIFVKRDDLLISSSGLCGNKYRKFESLDEERLKDVDRIVSWGGAQSNAMIALAKLTSFYRVRFTYFTKKLPKWLINCPIGNLKTAIKCGMELRQLENDEYHKLVRYNSQFIVGLLETSGNQIQSVNSGNVNPENENVLVVPQGGAWPSAEQGVRKLAYELIEQFQDPGFQMVMPDVIVASGTGAMALFLARHLQGFARVVAIPVVGDAPYLYAQMRVLDENSGGIGIFPHVLDIGKKRTFGKLCRHLFELWVELGECGISFDLLYAPVAWEKLLLGIEYGIISGCKRQIYYHCGGLEGNDAMLRRYNRYLRAIT